VILAFMLDEPIAFAWAVPHEEAPASETLLKLVESGKVAAIPALFS